MQRIPQSFRYHTAPGYDRGMSRLQKLSIRLGIVLSLIFSLGWINDVLGHDLCSMITLLGLGGVLIAILS
jgi:hypothetical protein